MYPVLYWDLYDLCCFPFYTLNQQELLKEEEIFDQYFQQKMLDLKRIKIGFCSFFLHLQVFNATGGKMIFEEQVTIYLMFQLPRNIT